nr:hypothetical protein [Tanacetum cinerariifolium]
MMSEDSSAAGTNNRPPMLEESDYESWKIRIEEYTTPYNQYLATKESQDVPTEASPIPPTAAYILQTLTDVTTQVEGHRKVNQEQALVNATLSAELDQCKLELARLERNKVKLECDQVIVARNKRNAKLEQETELLKTTLRNKEATIASLTSETKTVLSEKKTLEDKYLEEIVHWLSASDIASQSSDPPKPVTPFVHTRPMNSEVHIKVWNIKECLTPFEEVIKKCTAPPSDVLYHREYNCIRKCFDEEVIPFFNNIKQLFQLLDHNIYMEVKEFERIFDELDSEYEQTVLANKNL